MMTPEQQKVIAELGRLWEQDHKFPTEKKLAYFSSMSDIASLVKAGLLVNLQHHIIPKMGFLKQLADKAPWADTLYRSTSLILKAHQYFYEADLDRDDLWTVFEFFNKLSFAKEAPDFVTSAQGLQKFEIRACLAVLCHSGIPGVTTRIYNHEHAVEKYTFSLAAVRLTPEEIQQLFLRSLPE